MIELIGEEAKQDAENLAHCKKERKENNKNLDEKNNEMRRLDSEITELDATINNPKTGLKAQIADTEDSLNANHESQVTETADRKEANVAYQQDIKNLVSAEALLQNAIKVLKGYYDRFESLLQTKTREDPDAPETWGEYKGQSESGGNKAINMLEFILKENQNEEKQAHADEEKAQAEYEDSMKALKDEQAKQEDTLVKLQKELAESEETLNDREKDLKATTKDRDGIEAYLAEIKPGCDFITKNFDLREANRKEEKSSLKLARDSLKGSPAYTEAVRLADEEKLGKCKDKCVKDENHVNCKACLADVTVPGYCAGHKDDKVPGC